MDFLARLYAKIAPADAQGCRVWLGGKSREGYGRVRIGRGRDGYVAPAHIVVWEVERGEEFPAGMQGHHFRCNRAACVEPDHLRPETISYNSAEANRRRWGREYELL
jgi:hypothetical protein